MFDYRHVAYLFDTYPGRRLVVGYSGGLDSTVLMHALVRAARGLEIALLAAHVDHGLNPDSTAWSEHCRAFSGRLGVPFASRRIEVRKSGHGLEAAARTARYAALQDMMGPTDVLVLGHHRDDQVETMLFRLLRGADPSGLSGMAAERRMGSHLLVRPLLRHDRSELLDYAVRNRLAWVEDRSNDDLSLDRNFLRQRVIPVIAQRWPGFRPQLGRLGRTLGQDYRLVYAAVDEALRPLLDPTGEWLDLDGLRRLGEHLEERVLQRWILRGSGRTLPERVVVELRRQLYAAAPDARVSVGSGGLAVRVFRQRARLVEEVAQNRDPFHWDLSTPVLVNGRWLRAVSAAGAGLSPAPAELEVRFREGGETCRLPGRAGSRKLKKLLQEYGVPPWIRDRIPLLYRDGELAAVPGLFVCEGHEASPSQTGFELVWEPLPPKAVQDEFL